MMANRNSRLLKDRMILRVAALITVMIMVDQSEQSNLSTDWSIRNCQTVIRPQGLFFDFTSRLESYWDHFLLKYIFL